MSGFLRFFILPAALGLLAVLAGCTAANPSAGAARSAEMASTKPAARAGLGTGWGETRDSRTTGTSFARAGRPAGTDRLYYNDREGFEDLQRERYLVSAPSLQRAAGGLVSWGLRGSSQRSYRTTNRTREMEQRYVVGKKGARYEIVVRNETDRRVEAVLSVDGMDVLDGRAASLAKRGYILSPHETLRVDGFRTSESTVAAFRFSTVDRSYASLRQGDTRNVGVVGLAVFTEGTSPASRRFAQPPPNPELDRRQQANPFPGR